MNADYNKVVLLLMETWIQRETMMQRFEIRFEDTCKIRRSSSKITTRLVRTGDNPLQNITFGSVKILSKNLIACIRIFLQMSPHDQLRQERYITGSQVRKKPTH